MMLHTQIVSLALIHLRTSMGLQVQTMVESWTHQLCVLVEFLKSLDFEFQHGCVVTSLNAHLR